MEGYNEHRGAIERLVYYKIHRQADAEDVLQEIWLSAWQNRAQLTDAAKQKAWLIGIARHKIADYYRRQEAAPETLQEDCVAAVDVQHLVRDTLEAIPSQHRALLEYTYLQGYTLRDAARRLGVPVGTVKSRLSAARKAFRHEYEKGDTIMKKTFPKTMPVYSILPSEQPPFSVDCTEMGAWFFRAKEQEACHWAMYDLPGIDGHKTSWLSGLTHVNYAGKALIHGVQGLAFDAEDIYPQDKTKIHRWFVVQKTQTHVRWIAEAHEQDGAKKISTFLDDDFLQNWGSGEENIGDAIHHPAQTLDGRFRIRIGGSTHETMRLRARGSKETRSFHDRYCNAEGRTVLFQEFTRRDALLERGYQVDDSAETAEYQGETYVHWFDCIQDFVL